MQLQPILLVQLGKHNLGWKLKFTPPRQLYTEECPSPVPDEFISMQMSIPNPYSLIGPNSTILISWNAAILIGDDANDDIAVQLLLDRGSLSPTGQILILGTLL